MKIKGKKIKIKEKGKASQLPALKKKKDREGGETVDVKMGWHTADGCSPKYNTKPRCLQEGVTAGRSEEKVNKKAS